MLIIETIVFLTTLLAELLLCAYGLARELLTDGEVSRPWVGRYVGGE